MDVTTARPSLLSAAKNFMRRSAGKAALAIVPLAAAALAPEAKGQLIFGNMTSSGGAYHNPALGTYGNGVSNIFSSRVGDPGNGIQGVTFGADFSIAPYSGGSSQWVRADFFPSFSPGSSGDAAPGTYIPVAVAFNATTGSQTTITGWSLAINLYDSANTNLATFFYSAGTSGGDIAWNGSIDASSGFTGLHYTTATLAVYFNSNNLDPLYVTMSQAGQGITINPIPEPSTYALFAGLGMIGFVVLRRSRRLAA